MANRSRRRRAAQTAREQTPTATATSTADDQQPESRDALTLEDLDAQEQRIHAAWLQLAVNDFVTFARGMVIKADSGPRIFERCMAPFQRECFDDLNVPLRQLRDGQKPDRRRFWIERTKKASKDADLGLIILWMIGFATRPFYAQVGAANKEQAAIVKSRISELIHWNPWLTSLVEIVQWEVRSRAKRADGSPLAWLHIMSSDISGAHGGTPDLLIINELSHVQKWEFAENLMDNADGVAHGVVIIATNAGFHGSKAETWRANAESSPMWRMHVLSEPAPWHSPETIADARRRNSESRFKRLWMGVWVSGKGDAVSQESIDACFRLVGPCEPEEGWRYILGLDLGVSHDHCGLSVTGINHAERMIKVALWRRWIPPDGGEIHLPDVQSAVLAAARTYRAEAVYYDPHQAKLMAQQLAGRGIVMREMSFSVPSNLTAMATSFVQVVEDGMLWCYDDEDQSVSHDFGKLSIVEKLPQGYRLIAISDETGHADVATAIIITLPAAVDMLGVRRFLGTDEVLMLDDPAPFTEDDVQAMPDELREIYQM